MAVFLFSSKVEELGEVMRLGQSYTVKTGQAPGMESERNCVKIK